MSIRFERDERGGVSVWVDGQPQSYVVPADPRLLAFEYVEQLAIVIDSIAPSAARLAITHVGGAGLTLPRYVEATRPGSSQIVLEPDQALTEQVRREVPLPRGHRIRVRAVDGRRGVAALAPQSADAIVLDAFSSGQVPAELTTIEAITEAFAALRPGGMLAANLADSPDRRYLGRVVATLAAAGASALILATHDILKGRRFGNYVLAATRDELPLPELTRRAARAVAPAGVWLPDKVAALARSARPLTDADSQPSPAPPDPGRWRAR